MATVRSSYSGAAARTFDDASNPDSFDVDRAEEDDARDRVEVHDQNEHEAYIDDAFDP